MIQRLVDVEKIEVYERLADRLEKATVALFGPVPPNSDTEGDARGLEDCLGSPQKRKLHAHS